MSCYETPKTYGTEYKPIHPIFEFFSHSDKNKDNNNENDNDCNYSNPVEYGSNYGRITEFKNGKCVKRKGDNTIGIF